MWEVKRKDLVTRLTPQEVVANYTQFPEYIVRAADGTIDYIQAGLVNAADENVRGIDLGARVDWRGFNGRWRASLEGTYIDSYESRIFETQAYTELTGEWTRRTIYPRWKHTASVSYATGPWSATFLQRYVASYKDERPAGVVLRASIRRRGVILYAWLSSTRAQDLTSAEASRSCQHGASSPRTDGLHLRAAGSAHRGSRGRSFA